MTNQGNFFCCFLLFKELICYFLLRLNKSSHPLNKSQVNFTQRLSSSSFSMLKWQNKDLDKHYKHSHQWNIPFACIKYLELSKIKGSQEPEGSRQSMTIWWITQEEEASLFSALQSLPKVLPPLSQGKTAHSLILAQEVFIPILPPLSAFYLVSRLLRSLSR